MNQNWPTGLKEWRASRLKKNVRIIRYEPADRLDRGAAIIKQLLKIYI